VLSKKCCSIGGRSEISVPAFRDNLQIDLEDRRSFVVGNVFFRFLDTLKQTASL